jgi:tetratricopeptide (TPR) repeat protein
VVAADRGLRDEPALPLFGRNEIHDAALRTLEEARGGAGQFLLLIGASGVGKSTLLRQAVRDARERGYLVMVGHALPSDLPQPFALVQELLRSLHDLRRSESAPPSGDPSFLSLFLAPFGAGAHGGGPPAEGSGLALEADHLLSYLAGPPARVEESRTVLNDRLADFFLELTQHDPVLLAIDDLHLADDPSIEFLEQLAGRLGEVRLAVAATVVPPEEAPPRTAHLLHRLLHEGSATRLTVRAMTEPEVAQYARWLLKGRDPGREAVMRWFTQTEGNPLFVEYVVRGSLGALAGGIPPEAGAPGDLEEILRARVRALPEGDRRVLVYATVLGKEFDFPTLAVAAGTQEEERLAESVDRLVHGGLFREKGGEVYEFVSERVRAEAYAQLTETRRRILHRKVARALEARGRTDPGAIFELARQFYLGREDAPAVEYNRRAAELASRAFAHDTAVVHLERALEALRRQPRPDPTVELHLMIDLGRVLDESEQFHASEEVLERAVARARAAPERESSLALALLWLARTRSDLGNFPSALGLASEAFAILERAGNRRGLLVAHRVLGIAYWRNGDHSSAETHQREEIALAEGEKDNWERGHALIDLANTLVSEGGSRLPEALELYARAAELFADTRDYTAQARVGMNQALLYHGMGDLAKGAACLDRAIEAAERSHSHIWIGYCRMNQAQFYAEQGKPAEARSSIERSRTMLASLGDQYADQQFRMVEGMVLEVEGRVEEAAARFAEALKIAEELHFEAEVAEMHYRRARLLARTGRADEARAELGRARSAGLERLKYDLVAEADELERSLAAPGGTVASARPAAT